MHCIVIVLLVITKTNQKEQQIHRALHFFVENWARAKLQVRPAIFVQVEAVGQS